MKKIEYRCRSCGSNDVLQDAYVHMNTGEVSTYDHIVCNTCGYDSYAADEVEIETGDNQ